MNAIRMRGVALLACALDAAAADGEAEYDRRNAERYVALFTSLDRNGDGVVTRVEAQGDLTFSPRFDDMDINRDGAVTVAELQRFVLIQHGVAVGQKERYFSGPGGFIGIVPISAVGMSLNELRKRFATACGNSAFLPIAITW